ncbi:MAG: protein kinase domain-containing protein [Gemmatimonadales bacterium]
MSDLRPRLQAALAARYTIERELGRGGMATVYLARDLKHERAVAVKVLRPELSAALGPERFLQEIRLAANLTHPHILPLHDSGEAESLLYYVMPYVAGESLRGRIERERRLPLADALEIARDVADALDYAHRQNVVHRDIKPENILLEAGHAVVADFGIARAISLAGGGGGGARMTATGIIVGTPDYMSPEQAAGQGEVDGRSDVYSLGCVLYEMLVGEPPFAGAGVDTLLSGRAVASPSVTDARPEVPVEVELAIEIALARRPGDRYPTADDFARALEPTAAGGRGRGTWPRRTARRRAAAWTGALLAIGGVAVWGWLHGRGAPGAAGAEPLDPTHIAVLYFEDLSPGGTLAHVADGLTQDLIDELGAVSTLRVVSASGVRPYRRSSIPLDSITRALRVGALVEGSVARSGDLLRVTVRLIDAATATHLQSHTAEKPIGDLFALQDEMTAEVSRFLRERLGQEIRLREQRSGTKSIAAWQLMQRATEVAEEGWSHLREYDAPSSRPLFAQADSLFAQAVTLDRQWIAPVIARGWTAYARARVVWEEDFLARRGEGTLRRDSPTGVAFREWIRRGMDYAERALTLWPGAPEPLELLGVLRYELWLHYPPDDAEALVRSAEADLKAAVTARPLLARAWYTLSELYRQTGRFTEAAEAGRRALQADAYLTEARVVTSRLFFTALNRERFDEARVWCDEGVKRFPDALNFIDCELRVMGWAARGRRQAARAWRLLADIERRDTTSSLWADRRMLIAAILARSGLADSARAVIRRTRAAVSNEFVRTNLAPVEAYVRLLLGERAEALRLLSMALVTSPQMRDYVAQSPWFRSLRGDPRFEALVRGPRGRESGYRRPSRRTYSSRKRAA